MNRLSLLSPEKDHDFASQEDQLHLVSPADIVICNSVRMQLCTL